MLAFFILFTEVTHASIEEAIPVSSQSPIQFRLNVTNVFDWPFKQFR